MGKHIKRKASGSRQTGQIRIIGGDWRGRKFVVPDYPGLRPTTDRVRETVFNWLQMNLRGRRCLDLYSGAGALAFEAASRGAASVQMIELNTNVCRHLQSQIDQLPTACLSLYQGDALAWIDAAARDSKGYDIVFIDPPFDANLLDASCQALERQGLLADDALIYLECDLRHQPTVPDNWIITKNKTAGQVAYFLAQRA